MLGVGTIALARLARPLEVIASEAEPVEVALVAAPEDKPEPPPPPEAAATHDASPQVAAPRSLAAPDSVPDSTPDSNSAAPSTGNDPYAGARDDGGSGSGHEPAPPPQAPSPPPPPPPAPPAGPMRVDENVTPPEPISMPAPPYPEAARQAGIEGTVVVRYVVSASGDVTSAEVVRGPAELGAACVSVVRAWKFKPAIFDGHPVSVSRQAKFPFRIKT